MRRSATRTAPASSTRQRLTFHGNLASSRHGWLRLTPAYSVQIAAQLVRERELTTGPVLDPFCGTGTTLLACAEQGVDCDTVDVNPFLVWLARAKVARYTAPQRLAAERTLQAMLRAARRPGTGAWRPPLHQIERWWPAAELDALARAFQVLDRADLSAGPSNMLRLAFCRALIRTANVSFGHQSMSFRQAKHGPSGAQRVADELKSAFTQIAAAAATPLSHCRSRALLGDSRDLERVKRTGYGAVVTSPPYCNRMSYIRELRPYMYWLGHLRDKSGAGVLDWKAIGGTWGSATSNLQSWQKPSHALPQRGFKQLTARIAEHSPLLANYVARYFYDMLAHFESLRPLMARGATLDYIVGNSKFYDVLVPAEQILKSLMRHAGFEDVRIKTLRKRTSKAELFEYLVSARVPIGG